MRVIFKQFNPSHTAFTFIRRMGTKMLLMTATTVGINPLEIVTNMTDRTDLRSRRMFAVRLRKPERPSGKTMRSVYFSGVWKASLSTRFENAV